MRPAGSKNPAALERKQSQPDDITYNNPVAIADHNGAVHFLFCLEYMRAFHMRSATGPGHAIQLKNGRLLVPVGLSLGTAGNAAAELEDGTVILNIPTEAQENRRTVVVSKDGATHWSEPRGRTAARNTAARAAFAAGNPHEIETLAHVLGVMGGRGHIRRGGIECVLCRHESIHRGKWDRRDRAR